MPPAHGRNPTPWASTVCPSLAKRSSDRVSYGIPDVAGTRRPDFIGKRTLVVGSGHSAINVAFALMELQEAIPRPRSSGRSAIMASPACSAAV